MMGGESGRDPNEEDSRLESLKERLRQADQDEAVRTGSTQKGVDQGYRLGNRVLAELVGGIAGGALIGWFFDWLFSTSPWLLLEIGRASCRERVCQYVLISVVGVSLKKNNIKLRHTHHSLHLFTI